jgi:hypothetical protein
MTRAPSEKIAYAALVTIVTAIVALQRIAIPAGGSQISVVLPIVLLALVALLVTGALVEDRYRAAAYVLAFALCLAAALGSSLAGEEGSLLSILLLGVLYAPFVYVVRPELRRLYPRVVDFFCRLMLVGAFLSIGMWAAQMLGWRYHDLLAVLPPGWLLEDYNTSYPVRADSEIFKSNGIIFLEPSFCSQFLALALIAQLELGGKRWRLPIYVAGILTTVAGTGLLLIAFGLIVLAVRRGALWTVGMFLVTVLVAAAVAATPVGELLSSRAGETRDESSSFNLRFADPYERAYDALGENDSAPFVGRGPGFVNRETDEHFELTGLNLAFSTPTKLFAEYGLIAGAAFLAFIFIVFLSKVPSLTIAAATLFLHLTLSGSLLQPFTVYLGLVFASMFAVPTAVPALRKVASTPRIAATPARPQP